MSMTLDNPAGCFVPQVGDDAPCGPVCARIIRQKYDASYASQEIARCRMMQKLIDWPGHEKTEVDG